MTSPLQPYAQGMPYSQGVPVLPTMGSEAAMLGQAVQNLIAPNFQFQEQLKRALAANPELIGQLTNMEANSPGLIQQLFGQGMQTNALQQAKQQPGGKAEDAANKYKQGILDWKKEYFKFLKDTDPEKAKQFAESSLANELTGQNTVQTNQTIADTARAGAVTKAVEQDTAIKAPQAKQAGITSGLMDKSAAVRAKYPTMDSVMQAWKSGSLSTEEIAALQSDENNGTLIKKLFEADKDELMLKIKAMEASVDYARMHKDDDRLAAQAQVASRSELAAKIPIMQQLNDRRSGASKLTDEQTALLVAQLNEIEAKAHAYINPFKDKIGILPLTKYKLVEVPKKWGLFGGKKAVVAETDGVINAIESDPIIGKMQQEQEAARKTITGTSTTIKGKDEAFNALMNSIKGAPSVSDNTKR